MNSKLKENGKSKPTTGVRTTPFPNGRIVPNGGHANCIIMPIHNKSQSEFIERWMKRNRDIG